MRKALSIVMIMLLVLSLSAGSVCFAGSNITVKLDGDPISFDVPPQIINGRTMVPMRAIFEALGASVKWDGTTKTVTSERGYTEVSLTIGQPSITVDGVITPLDTAPCIIDGRTLVPVRAISEAFELKVDWDGATKTVIITGDGFSAKTAPEYLTDYGLSYSDDNAAITVYFAFRNVFSTAVKYNGTAKLTYKTADGTVIYQKDVAVNESMFKENEVGPYCEIVIPYSDLKNGKREDGTIALDFSNAADNKVYDQQIWAI